jgi:hypothetical protein
MRSVMNTYRYVQVLTRGPADGVGDEERADRGHGVTRGETSAPLVRISDPPEVGDHRPSSNVGNRPTLPAFYPA